MQGKKSPQAIKSWWLSLSPTERRRTSGMWVIALLYLIHYLVFCIIQPFYIEDAGISFAKLKVYLILKPRPDANKIKIKYSK